MSWRTHCWGWAYWPGNWKFGRCWNTFHWMIGSCMKNMHLILVLILHKYFVLIYLYYFICYLYISLWFFILYFIWSYHCSQQWKPLQKIFKSRDQLLMFSRDKFYFFLRIIWCFKVHSQNHNTKIYKPVFAHFSLRFS